MGTGNKQRRMKLDDVVWHVAGDSVEPVSDWLSTNFPQVLDEGTVLKEDIGTKVVLRDGIVLKRSQIRRGRTALRFGLRMSAARRAFVTGMLLADAGVDTPHPMAWATERRQLLRRADYLVTRAVTDSRSLTELLKTPDNHEEMQYIAGLLGNALGTFHRHGYSNRDMKDQNVLVTGESLDARLWIVDMDGVRKCICVTRKRAIRDFWPIVRSFGYYGKNTTAVRQALLRGYNAVVTQRLRLRELPDAYRKESIPIPVCPVHAVPDTEQLTS